MSTATTAPSARPWIRMGDATRCTRHHTEFVLPETCAGCLADPGPKVDDEIDAPLPPPPRGCKSPEQLERWFVTIAGAAERSASAVGMVERRVKGKLKLVRSALDFHDEGAIAKHRDNAIKAMRAATELALRRDDKALVDAREKRIRDRQRGASH